VVEFNLTDEQQMVKETFSRFSDERIRPNAEAIDDSKQFPIKLFKELAELGFYGLRYPESVGGASMDFVSYCLAVREIARGSLSLAAAAAMQSLMGTNFLFEHGNDDILERVFKPALEGKKIGSICITEPNAGSDLSAISTAAKKVDEGYVINGQKMWITAAPVADFYTVFARTGDDKKLTTFLVEKEFEGAVVGKSIEKMGVWGLPTSEVSFSDCFVPDTHRFGEEGQGESELRKILTQIRIMTAALALGVAQAAVDDSIKYAAERVQFGRPINRFQAIQIKLAEMGTDLEAATHLTMYAAWLQDQKKSNVKIASMAKLFATEAATSICDKASRIFASYGFAMEYPIQRYLRDIRFTLFGGGTSEIMKSIIARQMNT